jgi:hypothetical protein
MMTPQERGRLGGRATAAKYGKAHFAAIGASGYQTTVARHFGGDGIKCQNWLGKSKGMPRLNKREHDACTVPAVGITMRWADGSVEVW